MKPRAEDPEAPPIHSSEHQEPLLDHSWPENPAGRTGSSLLGTHPSEADMVSTSDPLSMTSIQSVFMLCNSAIGAGVLSLPFAFQHSGEAYC